MGFWFGIIMFCCIVPTLLITFFQMYPKNWKERKLIFGVRSREEFCKGDAEIQVNEIVTKYRKAEQIFMIACLVISVLLLILRDSVLEMTIWTVFTFAAIFGSMVPFALGNKEMKSLKKKLGLGGQAGIRYTDLNNAGAVHALRIGSMVIPNLVGLLLVLFAFFTEAGLIPVGSEAGSGSFLGTAVMGSSYAISLILAVFAVVVDRMKNEVVSFDSAVNANFNRAKKKNWADTLQLFLWVNTAYMAVCLILFFVRYSELWVMISLFAYLLLLMAGVAVFVKRERMIEIRYKRENSVLEDDDDYWLGGMIYYNPSDNRLNVEKRTGLGSTINMAHPGGKAVGVFVVLSLILTVLCLVWVGLVEATPVRLSVTKETIICHQLRDEYEIPLQKIRSAEWGEIQDLTLIRTNGVGMEDLLKGNFTVNGQAHCIVFLVPSAQNYIKIVTEEKTYYLSGADKDGTKAVYEAVTGTQK